MLAGIYCNKIEIKIQMFNKMKIRQKMNQLKRKKKNILKKKNLWMNQNVQIQMKWLLKMN
jgi:lysozyme family protein